MRPFFLFLFVIFLIPAFANAGPLSPEFSERVKRETGSLVGGTLQGDELAVKDVRLVIIQVIVAALTLVGIAFFCYMVYAGYLYMTARGESEQVTKALGIVRTSIVGLVIIFLSYAITVFVFTSLLSSRAGGDGRQVPYGRYSGGTGATNEDFGGYLFPPCWFTDVC